MRYPAILLLTFLLISAPCRAHDTHLSSLKFIRASDGVMVVSLTTHQSRLRAVRPEPTKLESAIRQRLKIRFDGQQFTPVKSRLNFDRANDLLTWQAEHARPVARIEVVAPLFPEDAASQLTVAVFEKGRVVQQAILSSAYPAFDTASLDEKPDTRRATISIIKSFGIEGIRHIFGGLDHVCFILGLLLLGGSIRSLFKTVTAFTIAHSITLALAALNIFAPTPRIIEPIIALSIIAVAAENFRQVLARENSEAQIDWRPAMAFGFGLIHGFGFAGALREIGLPSESLGPALVAFNVGVELGQVAIILLIAPALAWTAQKSSAVYHRLVIVGSTTIAIVGFCWFIQRMNGV